MTSQESLIEKVKKLLELSSSPNPHEAQLAFSRAQAMIAKYSLDLSQENKPEQITFAYYELKIKSAGIKEYLHSIVDTIAKIFSCHSLRNVTSARIRIFGYPTNLQIADYAIDSIINQLNSDLKEEAKKHRTISFSAAFWQSASEELSRKFVAQSKIGTGLVLYDKVKDYIYQSCKIVPTDAVHGSTYSAGFSSGQDSARKAQIRSALSSNSGGKLLN